MGDDLKEFDEVLWLPEFLLMKNNCLVSHTNIFDWCCRTLRIESTLHVAVVSMVMPLLIDASSK